MEEGKEEQPLEAYDENQGIDDEQYPDVEEQYGEDQQMNVDDYA